MGFKKKNITKRLEFNVSFQLIYYECIITSSRKQFRAKLKSLTSELKLGSFKAYFRRSRLMILNC